MKTEIDEHDCIDCLWVQDGPCKDFCIMGGVPVIPGNNLKQDILPTKQEPGGTNDHR